MTLDEAINQCNERAKGNSACAIDRLQLMEWLIELRELRESYERLREIIGSIKI